MVKINGYVANQKHTWKGNMTKEANLSESIKSSPFKFYGWVGLFVLIIGEYLLIQDNQFIKSWFTPIMWTGYILFIDALIFKLQGRSLISNRMSQFVFMLPYSVICWVIFEVYNLKLQNWQYQGLPEDPILRYWGYIWAFATIFPGVLLTSELIDILGIFNGLRVKRFTWRRSTLFVIMFVGVLFLVVPVLVPQSIAVFLFGAVWIGFVFLLDPVNYFIGAKSLFREWENGRLNKLFSLLLAGLICGLLWEFWNYWATAKWVYIFPYLREPKLFEMPVIGFLGFLPFAVEVYVMWELAVKILNLKTKRD